MTAKSVTDIPRRPNVGEFCMIIPMLLFLFARVLMPHDRRGGMVDIVAAGESPDGKRNLLAPEIQTRIVRHFLHENSGSKQESSGDETRP
jgi:hypothetical protein